MCCRCMKISDTNGGHSPRLGLYRMCCAGMLYHVELIVLHSPLQIRRLHIPKRVDWVALPGLEATEAMKAVTRTIWRHTVMIRCQSPNVCQQTIPHFIALSGAVNSTDTNRIVFDTSNSMMQK